jgi:hypothetical protein
MFPNSFQSLSSPARYPQMLPPDLSYTMDDVGMVIEMFSFRYDCWGAMTITDFDPARGVHKCRCADASYAYSLIFLKMILTLRCAIPIESCGAMFFTNSILSNGTTLLPHYRLTDGTVQLLDLKKKPIRAAPIRIDNE